MKVSENWVPLAACPPVSGFSPVGTGGQATRGTQKLMNLRI